MKYMKYEPNEILIQNSNEEKYLFFYKDNSISYIYYKGDIQIGETLLISQVNKNFICGIDRSDKIYLLCESRFNTYYLFYNDDGSWKMTEIKQINEKNAVLLKLCVLDDKIHILYGIRLPLMNFIGVYHIYKNGNEWNKNYVTDIYSCNADEGYSIIYDKNYMYLFNVNKKKDTFTVNYNIYSINENKWTTASIANLFSDRVKLQSIKYNDRIDLLCYTIEDEKTIVFYFCKDISQSNEFSFISLNVLNSENYKIPLVVFCNDSVYMITFSSNTYYYYRFDQTLKEWEIIKKGEIIKNDESNKLVQNISNNYNIIYTECYIDNDCKVLFPIFEKECNVDIKEDIISNDEYIPYIVDQIKTISDNLNNINTKITKLEANSNKTIAIKKDIDDNQVLRKSNFKERFMSNDYSDKDGTAVFCAFNSKKANGYSQNNLDEIHRNSNFKEAFMKKKYPSGNIYNAALSASNKKTIETKNTIAQKIIQNENITKEVFPVAVEDDTIIAEQKLIERNISEISNNTLADINQDNNAIDNKTTKNSNTEQSSKFFSFFKKIGEIIK